MRAGDDVLQDRVVVADVLLQLRHLRERVVEFHGTSCYPSSSRCILSRDDSVEVFFHELGNQLISTDLFHGILRNPKIVTFQPNVNDEMHLGIFLSLEFNIGLFDKSIDFLDDYSSQATIYFLFMVNDQTVIFRIQKFRFKLNSIESKNI